MVTASKQDKTSEVADSTKAMLMEAFRHVKGTLDFDGLATKMDVANGEAM